MKRINLRQIDLAKLLNIDEKTMGRYIKDPFLINLRTIILMSGVFGMAPEELVYIILRNKPQLNKTGKWYLNDIKAKHVGNEEDK